MHNFSSIIILFSIWHSLCVSYIHLTFFIDLFFFSSLRGLYIYVRFKSFRRLLCRSISLFFGGFSWMFRLDSYLKYLNKLFQYAAIFVVVSNWPFRNMVQFHFFFFVWILLFFQYSFIRLLYRRHCSTIQKVVVSTWNPFKHCILFRNVSIYNIRVSVMSGLCRSFQPSLIHTP